MDCADFEHVLAALLAAPGTEAETARLSSLRAHAEACPACAGSVGLLDLAALPIERRDPIGDPGDAYWNEFEAGLAVRIAEERSKGRRRRALAAGIAVAAVAMIAVLAISLRDARQPEPGGPFRSETPAVRNLVDPASTMDDDSVSGFTDEEPIDAFTEDDPGDLFPPVDQMTPLDTERLLESLKAEEARVRKGAA